MTSGKYQMKIGLLVWMISILPLIAIGQGTAQGQAPAQIKPEVSYSQNMTAASRELQWSRKYFDSYKKTKEAVYLQLAASHCANAVNVLKATQASFPNTTRFYYKAKNKRFDACRYFKELQDTSLRLDPSHHVKNLPDNGCEF